MMRARFTKDGKLEPIDMGFKRPPPPAKTYGIKVKVPLDATEQEVLKKAREAVERQDTPQITDPRINFLEYEYTEKEYDEWVASDVRGGIFSLYVHRYSRHQGTQRIPVAEYWSVMWEARDDS